MDDFEKARNSFFEGLDFLKSQQFAQAEQKLLESLALIPDRISTLTNLAAAQIKLKKYDEAKEMRRTRHLSGQAEQSEAWLNLGLVAIATNTSSSNRQSTLAMPSS